jgi:hypothetical protein
MESAVKENSFAAESRRVRVTDTLGFSCIFFPFESLQAERL